MRPEYGTVGINGLNKRGFVLVWFWFFKLFIKKTQRGNFLRNPLSKQKQNKQTKLNNSQTVKN